MEGKLYKDNFTSLKIEENFKNLQYLDLAYSFKDRNIISLDNYRFICRFNKNFRHILHSESEHLNSLTDLIISLGISLEKSSSLEERTLEKLIKAVFDNKRNIVKGLENSDYIKEQNETVLSEIKKTKKVLPSKEDIRILSHQIEHNKPKIIELEIKQSLLEVNEKVKKLEEQYSKIQEILKQLQHIITS